MDRVSFGVDKVYHTMGIPKLNKKWIRKIIICDSEVEIKRLSANMIVEQKTI